MQSIVSETMSLCEYTEQYYLPFFKTRPLSKIKSDLYRIDVILADSITEKALSKLNRNDFVSLLQRIEGRGISRATVNRFRSQLSAIMNHAMYGGLIAVNPVKQIRKYKELPRDRVLNLHEISRLLSECKKSKNKDLFLVVIIALYTGMRQGEILNLESMNMFEDCIKLHAKQTKSGYSRTIPLHDDVLIHLEEYLKGQKDVGRIFKFKSIRTAWENAVKRAQLKDLRFHDLRRTCATWLKDSDVNIYTICKILGHCNTAMTERYLTNNNGQMRVAIDKLSFIGK